MANLQVDVQEFTTNGGRIAHITESNGRVVTLAYRRNCESSTIQYGATIYRDGDDAWNRRESNQLAVLRATRFPVVIPDNSDWSGSERKVAVRTAMYTHGVSKR